MISTNNTKIQIVKELLDKKQITFEQALILIDEPKTCNCENKNNVPFSFPHSGYLYRSSTNDNTCHSSLNDNFTSK